MADEPKFGFGIVIRADGTVPFDADLHPDHKAAILSHLRDSGHEFEHAHDDNGNHQVVLTSGPLMPSKPGTE